MKQLPCPHHLFPNRCEAQHGLEPMSCAEAIHEHCCPEGWGRRVA